METVLFIKRNHQLITEENAKRDFFRFFQDKEKSIMREIVEDSDLSKLLNENFVDTIREETRFLSESNYQKIFEFAAVLNKKRNKKRLRILIVSPHDYVSEILNAFTEWGEHTGIEFISATDNDNSDIRVSFERNSGHWSFIGREAEHISLAGKPTINFDPADLERLDLKNRMGIFLHEIGHSIGLIHEHQKDASPIIWDKTKVYDDCSAWFGWDNSKVEHNIFNLYNSNDLFYSKEFDVKSIMIYPIPAGWSTNYKINNPNTELSSLDKRFAKAFYSL